MFYKVPYIDIFQYEFDVETVKSIPRELALEHNLVVLENHRDYLTACIPMEHHEDNNKANALREVLRETLNKRIYFVKSQLSKISHVLEKYHV